MLVIVVSKLLYGVSKIMAIIIVLNRLHPLVIISFNYWQKKPAFANISTTKLSYFLAYVYKDR